MTYDTHESWLVGMTAGPMVHWYATDPRNPSRWGGSPLSVRKLRLLIAAIIREFARCTPDGGVGVACHFMAGLEQFADSCRPGRPSERLEEPSAGEVMRACESVLGKRNSKSIAATNVVTAAFGGSFQAFIEEIDAACRAVEGPLGAGFAGLAAEVTRSQLGYPHRPIYYEHRPGDHHAGGDGRYYLLSGLEGTPGFWSARVYAPVGDVGRLKRAMSAQRVLLRHDWISGEVGDVARAIYQADSFEDLPRLADLLERLDCDDELLLAALRGKQICSWCAGEGRIPCGNCGGSGDRPGSKRHVYDPGANPYLRGGSDLLGDVCNLCMGNRKCGCGTCGGSGFVLARTQPRKGFWALDAILMSWNRYLKETPLR